MHLDSYGTRQMIICVTGGSKVFGIHSTNGATIWATYIPPTKKGGRPPKLTHLFVQRHGTHHVMIIADDGDGFRLLTLDAFSGKVLATADYAGSTLLHVVKLPFGASEAREHTDDLIMLVDDTLGVSVFPDNDASRSAFLSHMHDTYFYVLDERKLTLTGYGIVPSPSKGFKGVVVGQASYRARGASFPLSSHTPGGGTRNRPTPPSAPSAIVPCFTST
jgi:hypothetical protein